MREPYVTQVYKSNQLARVGKISTRDPNGGFAYNSPAHRLNEHGASQTEFALRSYILRSRLKECSTQHTQHPIHTNQHGTLRNLSCP